MNPLSKIPFLSLLLPLIIGILLQYFLKTQNWSIAFFCIGGGVMLLSYFMPKAKEYSFRWLFGVGLYLFVVGIGITSTFIRQQKSVYIFEKTACTYDAVVLDIPQEKPKSMACKTYLPDYDQFVICYFQKDSLTRTLFAGDRFTFNGIIQPFQNISDFDYAAYMHNKGFVGQTYIPAQSWLLTGETDNTSLKIKALRCRQHILSFYKSLGFNDNEYSILSALTLGYQDALSDDMKQSFRTTGTVHVLSVSGLHVGIIYAMIAFFLSFIRPRSKLFWTKPLLIIIALWIYAFITGLPPSVVRASTMLSIFCVAQIVGRKHSSLHSLFIAAFFMLLYNPLSFFDIGFQLSFVSVLSILYLHPKVTELLMVKNKYLRKMWQMFTLSLVAQLATFPICLYYFGTFPTYFFIANLVIVPLVVLITYAFVGVIVAKMLSALMPSFESYLYYLPVKTLQLLVRGMTLTTDFFESLPFALIENVKISLLDLILIFQIIIALLMFSIYKKINGLRVGIISVVILIVALVCGV